MNDKDGVAAERRADRERELMRSNSERDRNSHPRELARDFNDQRDVNVSLAKYSCRGEVNKRAFMCDDVLSSILDFS